MSCKKDPYITDLFGEIPVTQYDIDNWMRIEAPNISTLRTKTYIRQWNVIEKIKQAKIKGEF
jgi:hypothetical protein